MKSAFFLSGLLLFAGLAQAQTGNQGPPNHWRTGRGAQQPPTPSHNDGPGAQQRSGGERHDSDRNVRHDDHDWRNDHGPRDRDRDSHWRGGSRSGWNVGVHIEIGGGGHWGHPVPRCEPVPAPCPPPPPVCDMRTERLVVPGYWVDTPMVDHCGRQCFDRWGRPIMTRSYVPGYVEVITYQREVYRFWDGRCWRESERWIEVGRERTAC